MHRRPTPEEMMEIFDLSWGVFKNKIEDQLTDADYSQHIAIDVDTGDWEIGSGASDVLESRNKDARIINMFYPFSGTSAVGVSETPLLEVSPDS